MEQLGDYEYSKRDLIGHGAFAVVFKGRFRKSPQSTVAIKSITKKNIAKSQALLSKEIKILKELSSLQHENVVALMDCKETSHHLYLVMEYCNGGDLADYLQLKGTLSEDTIAMFLTQIAGAMKALYGMGIVHRDLKPQNLLLDHSSKDMKPNEIKGIKPSEIKIKIADFGFARFLQDGVMAATLCGSPMYMAPEVIMSQQYDAKADLWSIGTIVYQCLTGKAPFQAQTPQQLKAYYEKTPNLQPNVPSGTSALLRDLLLRLLKRNSSDRIEFSSFFTHPFVTKYAKPKASAPVAVPSTPGAETRQYETDSGDSASTNSLQAVSVSPLSTARVQTPPYSRDTRDTPPSPNTWRNRTNNGGQTRTRPDSEEYVMVPGNCPADHKAYLMDEARASQQLSGSPADRPATLPVLGSAPLPVPTQRQAYEQIQKASFSPRSPARLRHHSNRTESPRSRRNSESSSNVDVGSITPPNMTFAVGTPPNSAGYKGQYVSRPRSSTESSLRNMQNSPTQQYLERQRPNSNNITTSRSFSERQQLSGLFSGSAGRLTDLVRRPSFAQDITGDLTNKENFPGGQAGGYNKDSPVATFPYAQSPPNMDGPVMFVVPELTDETLLSNEHRDTLGKLQFISTVIYSLIELAQSRTSPLLESRNSNKLTGCVVFVSEKQRRMEQLVLYIRALHLLSSSLQLAKSEVAAGKLQPSSTVKSTVKELNGFYHTCLDRCKLLKSRGVETGSTGVDQQFLNKTADKLIYEHAIELCQQAALDELFGNPIECVKRYRNAHTLLHSLAQMTDLEHDRRLLNSHKTDVENRLIYLESQGYCIALS